MNVQLIEFPKILDLRGNLTFFENPGVIPFDIKRVFWTYDVPGGEIRGGHAYRTQVEIIIALSGSFDVIVTGSDSEKKKFQLNRSYYGLLVPPMIWRHMENFSTNAVGLHVSSSVFDRKDYIRDFEEYKSLSK